MILRRREMGKIPELREQKSHGAAKDSLEQRGVREKGGKKEKRNEHITNPKQSTIFELPTEFYTQRVAVKLKRF